MALLLLLHTLHRQRWHTLPRLCRLANVSHFFSLRCTTWAVTAKQEGGKKGEESLCRCCNTPTFLHKNHSNSVWWEDRGGQRKWRGKWHGKACYKLPLRDDVSMDALENGGMTRKREHPSAKSGRSART